MPVTVMDCLRAPVPHSAETHEWPAPAATAVKVAGETAFSCATLALGNFYIRITSAGGGLSVGTAQLGQSGVHVLYPLGCAFAGCRQCGGLGGGVHVPGVHWGGNGRLGWPF